MLLELCKHFSYINIPTSSAFCTDVDNKYLHLLFILSSNRNTDITF